MAALIPSRAGKWSRGRVGRYRLGGAVLEVATEDEELLSGLDARYGDCATTTGDPDVRCEARRSPSGGHVVLCIEGAGIPDPVDLSLRLFRPLRRRGCYAESSSPPPGCRVIENQHKGGAPLLVGAGRGLVVDLEEAPDDFITDLLVASTQCAQPDVAFVHAASVGVGGSGALFVGNSKAGKSTMALTLAIRGHTFLADDISALRPVTGELLPYRKSVGVRSGPLPASLGESLGRARHITEQVEDGSQRSLVRALDVLGPQGDAPVPLRISFILSGFGDRPRAHPFQVSLAGSSRLRSMEYEVTVGASWGASRGTRLMTFLTLVNLLGERPCFLLESGTPEQTADLVEQTMEQILTDPWVSTTTKERLWD